MSASAPGLLENSDGSGPRALWLTLSLLLHGALLAGIVFFLPQADMPIEDALTVAQAESVVSASSGRIQDVAQQIELTQAEELRLNVSELLETDQSLGELQEQTQKEFMTIASELTATSPKKIQNALETAAAAQSQAVQAQQEALGAADALQIAREAADGAKDSAEKTAWEKTADAASTQAGEAQMRAKDAQAAATAAQLAALEQLGFQSGIEEAKSAQALASSAQNEANLSQDKAIDALGSLSSLKRVAAATASGVVAARRSADAVQKNLATAENASGKQEQAVQQQQDLLDQNTSAGGEQKKNQALRKTLESLKGRQDAAKTNLDKVRIQLAVANQKVALAVARAEKTTSGLLTAPGTVSLAQSEAAKTQQNAGNQQALARSTLLEALVAASNTSPSFEAAPAPPESTVAPPLKDQSLPALYATAVKTEQSIAGRYQFIRSAQVAAFKQIPLLEAGKYVQVAVPVRSELPPAAWTAPVTDRAGLEEQKAAIEQVRKELDSMLSLSRGMAAQARRTAQIAGGEAMRISVEPLEVQAAQQRELAELATEMEGQVAVDLTGAMNRISEGKSPGEEFSAKTAPGTGANGSGRAGGGAGGDASERSLPGYSLEASSLPAPGTALESVPGRKVHGQGYGVGAKWMYLDTWWVIGPFPNPQRRNIETRFPPESVIDLDATYLVEGATVGWHFVQNPSTAVRPPLERPYAIYYAYTELWCDEARDLWIAVGSDDYSKIWLNNLLVWASGTQHKSWRANEGYRKVKFQQGLNRILMRVENGHAGCAFSLMVRMQANP